MEPHDAQPRVEKAEKPICAHVLIVCKCKAKVRNRKGFGPKFMHTCAFCVLFLKSASGSPPSCVSHQGDFAYILSNRASESRLVKRQKILIFANIEDVGRHPLFCALERRFCAVLSRFSASTGRFSKRLGDNPRSTAGNSTARASTPTRHTRFFTNL